MSRSAAIEPSIRKLAATMEDRARRIQQQYNRETGRKLDYADAFSEMLRRAENDEPVDGDAGFTREDMDPVAYHLACLEYSPQAIAGAMADIGRTGTAKDSIHVNPEDRDAVEELIPERSTR